MAERWFRRQAERDERHVYFDQAYDFHIVRGGRMGGRDPQQFEVFYGNRPVDQVVETVVSGYGLPESRIRLAVENGAALHYLRTGRGTVKCHLTPATFEGGSSRESAILLGHFRSARSLHSPFTIDAHWRALMSYFECTALDGDPRWCDRLRVEWLRFTRPLRVEGETLKPVYKTRLAKMLEWSLTIGLSGAVLFVLQWLIGPPTGK